MAPVLWGPGILSFIIAFVAAWLLARRFTGFALDRPNDMRWARFDKPA